MSGNELVLKLYSAIRSVMTAQHDISALRETVEGLLKDDGKLSIKVGRDRLLLNDQRIEMRSGHTINQILLKEFQRRGIGKIEFAGLPDIRDLEVFFRSMIRSDNGQITGEMLQRALEKKNVESVRVHGAVPGAGEEELGLSAQRPAHYTRVYFYAIQLVKDMFRRAKGGDSLELSLARRVIQSMVSGYADAPAIFMGLATTKTNRDFLANHSVNVAIYAIALGHRLGLSKPFLSDLGLAAIFHDIGESHLVWLRRTGRQRLTDQEWAQAKLHPALGVKIMMGVTGSDATTLSRLMAGIFGHHLRYDLSGFPKLKRKQKVSLVAKIISLADFYDLGTRPYGRNQFPCFSERIPELIIDRATRDFDPVLAKYFVRVIGILPVGTLCRLDTGELGIVCRLMEEGSTGRRPWVRLLVPAGETYRGGDVVCLDSVDENTGTYRRSICEIVDPNPLRIDVAEYLIEF